MIFSFNPLDNGEVFELKIKNPSNKVETPFEETSTPTFNLCTGYSTRYVQGLSFKQDKSFTQNFSVSDRASICEFHMDPRVPICNEIDSTVNNQHDALSDFLDTRYPEKFPFESRKKWKSN